MSLKITVDEPLATQLCLEADRRGISVQALITRELFRAVQETGQYQAMNHRHSDLLQRQLSSRLSSDERDELQQLQTYFDQLQEGHGALLLVSISED